MTEQDQMLTVEEACVELGLKAPTLRRWITERRIGHVRMGTRAIRIPRSEVYRVIKQGRVEARDIREFIAEEFVKMRSEKVLP